MSNHVTLRDCVGKDFLIEGKAVKNTYFICRILGWVYDNEKEKILYIIEKKSLQNEVSYVVKAEEEFFNFYRFVGFIEGSTCNNYDTTTEEDEIELYVGDVKNILIWDADEFKKIIPIFDSLVDKPIDEDDISWAALVHKSYIEKYGGLPAVVDNQVFGCCSIKEYTLKDDDYVLVVGHHA